MSRTTFAALTTALFCLTAPVAVFGQSSQLPEGPGQQIVEQNCTTCHTTREIRDSSGYTQDGWRELVLNMLPLDGTPELDEITRYLAANFPPNTKRQPKLMPGSMSVKFQEWKAPTLGQRTRDPVQAPDGSIWFSGMWRDLVGRIDPKTGEIQEFPLPPDSKAHTVAADRDGGIWYTGNGNGTLGKLDPRTGESKVFKMPDPAARDPHSMIINSKGTIFFTLQQSNMVGRLIPSTGEIKLVTMPTPRARPYGIKLSSEEVPWVASNGSNRLFRIDPDTMAVREFILPDPATTVRRLAIADDDTVWYVNSSRGRIGRLDPKTGEVKEWPSPSGPKSHPYAIAILDGAIWYNESGQRPDALYASIPRPNSSKAGPFRPAAFTPASFGICARHAKATC